MVSFDLGLSPRAHIESGAFPGPTIEARSGDRLVVEVQNRLEDEGVTFHWHGLHMRGQYTFYTANLLLTK